MGRGAATAPIWFKLMAGDVLNRGGGDPDPNLVAALMAVLSEVANGHAGPDTEITSRAARAYEEMQGEYQPLVRLACVLQGASELGDVPPDPTIWALCRLVQLTDRVTALETERAHG